MKFLGERIVLSKGALPYLENFISSRTYSKVLVLVDENTREHCLPHVRFSYDALIEIQSGEANKSIQTCELIWKEMLEAGADRHSLLINLGGGVIGDMGGFCASTYMRGIDFIQVPTTLLAMVDASAGGKLGVDMNYAKNLIGLFREPSMVFIHLPFLDSLSQRQWMSGYAEMLKHGLIADTGIWGDLKEINQRRLLLQVEKSIEVKAAVVEEDPFESGYRKVLNFGHTIGHGLESFALERGYDVLHGEAVAAGMQIESILSAKSGLTREDLSEIKTVLNHHFKVLPFQISEAEAIWSYILKDKKNKSSVVNCTLLQAIGSATIDRPITFEEFEEAFANYLSV